MPTSETILVDGMNLIYKFPDLAFFLGDKRYSEAQSGLIDILHSHYKNIDSTKVQVFFDGKKDYLNEIFSEEKWGIGIHYSHDLTADELILGYLKQSPQPGSCLVITSDKEILSFSRRMGARRVTSEDFYKEWLKEKEEMLCVSQELVKESPPDATEVDYWEKEFSR